MLIPLEVLQDGLPIWAYAVVKAAEIDICGDVIQINPGESTIADHSLP